MNVSANKLCLADVSWLTEDVHKLIYHLSITKLSALSVSEECQLSHGSSPPTAIPLVRVNTTDIKASLKIDTLQYLLSRIQVHDISFQNGAQVLDMDKYKPPKHQVHHHYQLHYCLLIY